jgi:hypothetical protein
MLQILWGLMQVYVNGKGGRVIWFDVAEDWVSVHFKKAAKDV